MQRNPILTNRPSIFSAAAKNGDGTTQLIRNLQNTMRSSSQYLNKTQELFIRTPAFHIAQKIGWLKTNPRILAEDKLSAGLTGITLMRGNNEADFQPYEKFLNIKSKKTEPIKGKQEDSFRTANPKSEKKLDLSLVLTQRMEKALRQKNIRNFANVAKTTIAKEFISKKTYDIAGV